MAAYSEELKRLIQGGIELIALGSRRGGEIGRECGHIVRLLRGVRSGLRHPDSVQRLARSESPAGLRHLGSALAEARKAGTWPRGLAEPFERICAELPWSTFYARGRWSQSFIDDLVMATVVGINAPVRSYRVTLGFLVQGPHTCYPPHGHEATELYIVVGGGALFRSGAESDWTERAPGSYVLHPGNMPHAMQTREAPLLALYAWHGNLTAPSWFKHDMSDPDERPKYPPLLRDT